MLQATRMTPQTRLSGHIFETGPERGMMVKLKLANCGLAILTPYLWVVPGLNRFLSNRFTAEIWHCFQIGRNLV